MWIQNFLIYQNLILQEAETGQETSKLSLSYKDQPTVVCSIIWKDKFLIGKVLRTRGGQIQSLCILKETCNNFSWRKISLKMTIISLGSRHPRKVTIPIFKTDTPWVIIAILKNQFVEQQRIQGIYLINRAFLVNAKDFKIQYPLIEISFQIQFRKMQHLLRKDSHFNFMIKIRKTVTENSFKKLTMSDLLALSDYKTS